MNWRALSAAIAGAVATAGITAAEALDPARALSTNPPHPACIKLDTNGVNLFLEQWNEALSAGNLDRFLALYTADAVIVPLGSTSVASGVGNLRVHYAKLMQRPLRVQFAEVITRSDCNLTILGGTFSYVGVHEKPDPVRAGNLRFRLDLVFRDGRWLVGQHQSSYLTPNSERAVKMASGGDPPTVARAAAQTARPAARTPSNGSANGSALGGYKAATWDEGGPSF